MQNGQEASDNNTQSEKTEKEEDSIDRLFLSLAGIYGYLWTSMHKEISAWAAAKKQWRKGLEEIKATVKEVNAALEKCRHLKSNDGSAKLVNLQEFLGFIETARKAKNNNFHKCLPKPLADQNKAHKFMDECLRKLGRQPKYA